MTSSPAGESALEWPGKTCSCEACKALNKSVGAGWAAYLITSPQSASYLKISKALDSIVEARNSLRVEHQAEPAFEGLNIAEGDVPSTLTSLFTPQQCSTESKKFLVCDHCMAHGLICNEASVCDQCREYGQPCIHRWCSISPTTIDACTNPRCHYAHMDSIPHTENEPKWIIFKGDLPTHLERGKLRSLGYGKHLDAFTDQKEWMDALNNRQVQTLSEALVAAKSGEGTYAEYRVNCDCASNK